MLQHTRITDRILTQIRCTPDCALEALVSSLPELTWQDIFLEVDRLSRTGQMRLTRGTGTTSLRLSLPDVVRGPDSHSTWDTPDKTDASPY
jgi:hypothetical protein